MVDTELPSWLNADFLSTSLQGGEDGVPQVSVKKFSAATAVGAGDNYLSRIYRIRVEYTQDGEEKCTSVIVKAPFTNSVMNYMVDESEFYSKEPTIYKSLLPLMNDIAKSEFGPTCYRNSTNNALILSDLREQGFEMCDRYKQLDFPHCEQVFKTLAKFHGASVLCKKGYPELIKQVGKEMFYNDSEQFDNCLRPWIKRTFQIVADIVKEMKLSDSLVELISNKAETIADSLLKLCKPKESGLNVLNHGDLWVNNILFKHSSSGEVVDIRFVDFQVAKYTSPVWDLIYLIWTSANEDVRETRIQDLIEIYRLTLNSELEELGCEERLTAEELREDFKEAIDWVLLMICNMLPIIVCDAENVMKKADEIDPEGIVEMNDTHFKHFNGRYFRAMLPNVMTNLLSWLEYYK